MIVKTIFDPHFLKYEVLGKKAQISRYDIYLDTTNNIIWLGSKSKPMHWIEPFITFGGS